MWFWFRETNNAPPNRVPMQVSVDGITWADFDTYSTTGSAEPDRVWGIMSSEIDGVQWHVWFSEEEYLYKSGNANAGTLNAATGFSVTSNNGVLGGIGGRVGHCIISDGTAMIASTNGSMNAILDPSNHPAGWGPDGNSNTGWSNIDMDFTTATNAWRTVLIYDPTLDRPYVMFNGGGETVDNGWWDCADITVAADPDGTNNPEWARPTVEPFVTLQTRWDANKIWATPRVNGAQGTVGNFQCRNDAASVYGTDGYLIIMQDTVSNPDDYLVFKRPSG